MQPQDLMLGLVWYAALLASLTLHEAAHAWVALRLGDPTAYRGGQVTLDPRPHVRREPMGMVFVPLFFFATSGFMIGWASTPFDPRWAWEKPRSAAWMSLAGPAANFALVLAAAMAIRAGLAAGVFAPPDFIGFASVTVAAEGGVWALLATLASVLFTLNLLLGVFNLIPLPPLDGTGLFTLLAGDGAARRFQLVAQRPIFSLLGIVAAWFLIGPLFRPLFARALALVYAG